MVTSTRQGAALRIVAKPDHSSTWHTNLLVVAALSIPCLGFGIVFAFMGAWPILPLAGLELACLTAALYVVNRRLQCRHVITVEQDTVTLAKGFGMPTEHWRFPRDTTGLCVVAEKHPWEGPALALHDRKDRVPLGEFLSRDDTLRLIELLQQEIKVAPKAHPLQVTF